MPEPYSKESIDYIFLYPLCKEISKSFCSHIHPNFITFTNLIISLYIIDILNKNKFELSTVEKIFVIIIITIRAIMDGLDGTVARMYKKTSELGGILDEWCDIIFFIGLITIIYNESIIYTLILIIPFILYYLNLETKYMNILHDNTLIVTPLIVIIMFIIKDINKLYPII
jgi:hypothetical protein